MGQPNTNEEGQIGGVMFLSKDHLRYLAVNEDDDSLVTTNGEEETNIRHFWRMDPCLPSTISGGKIAALSVAAAVGLSVAVFMPFAVLGAIEAAGATITELALLGV